MAKTMTTLFVLSAIVAAPWCGNAGVVIEELTQDQVTGSPAVSAEAYPACSGRQQLVGTVTKKKGLVKFGLVLVLLGAIIAASESDEEEDPWGASEYASDLAGAGLATLGVILMATPAANRSVGSAPRFQLRVAPGGMRVQYNALVF